MPDGTSIARAIALIKTAVDEGQVVHWSNHGYVVTRDRLGQYLVTFTPNGHCIGLTNRAGTALNGQPCDFFVCEDVEVCQ